jgi:hypothetical protein
VKRRGTCSPAAFAGSVVGGAPGAWWSVCVMVDLPGPRSCDTLPNFGQTGMASLSTTSETEEGAGSV